MRADDCDRQRRWEETAMFETILLVVNGSRSSARAVPATTALAARFRGRVVVVELPDPAGNGELSSEVLGGAPPLADRIAMDLRDHGVSARPALWAAPRDERAASIAEVAEHERADLIVMAA